jgi:hypothetical protein
MVNEAQDTQTPEIDNRAMSSEPGIRERMVTMWVRINVREIWYLPCQDSGRKLLGRLDALIGLALDDEPPVWIDNREESDGRIWYVIHNGRRWRGEDLAELGEYDVIIRIRGV